MWHVKNEQFLHTFPPKQKSKPWLIIEYYNLVLIVEYYDLKAICYSLGLLDLNFCALFFEAEILK